MNHPQHDQFELGERVAVAFHRENDGPRWLRLIEIHGRFAYRLIEEN